MKTHREALARTTLLLNEEWFAAGADETAIADALLASTVRITADAESMSCRAGQTALVTAFMLIARMGIGIELQTPNVELIDPVAPLRRPRVVDALVDLGSDLVPGARVRTSAGEVDETFILSSCEADDGSSVRVWANDTEAALAGDGEGAPCTGDLPFGGFAAGTAAAAIALEAARQHIEQAAGLAARSPRPSPGPPVRIQLERLFPGLSPGIRSHLGRLDAISGGAITHALVFCLLRTPQLQAQMRVIESQSADLSNVNRYSLLRASEEGDDKVELLEHAASERVEITGVKTLFTKETRDTLLPLAEHVAAGVDDVEARWWVAETDPAWLAIGGTSNHLAQLTIHVPGGPCAACVHPVALTPVTIPTISFVSFWAGVMQACALVSGATEPANISILPFALGGASPVISASPVANQACPIRCYVSRAADVRPSAT